MTTDRSSRKRGADSSGHHRRAGKLIDTASVSARRPLRVDVTFGYECVMGLDYSDCGDKATVTRHQC